MGLAHSPSIVRNGLVLHLDAANIKSYPGSGTVWSDLSGLGNNGTLTNGPTFNSENGGGIVLDGGNDFINIPHSPSLQLTSELTIMFWFMPYNFSASRQGLLGRNGLKEYTITLETSGRVSLYFQSTNQTANYYNLASSKVFGQTNNVFQQLTVTRSFITNKIYFYKNGTQTDEVTMVNVDQPIATIEPTGVGNGNGGYFNGRVGVFGLYNRALTSQEISQNFNALRGRYGI